eukprot:PhF_6_TR32876/c0_g1_i1/m.48369
MLNRTKVEILISFILVIMVLMRYSSRLTAVEAKVPVPVEDEYMEMRATSRPANRRSWKLEVKSNIGQGVVVAVTTHPPKIVLQLPTESPTTDPYPQPLVKDAGAPDNKNTYEEVPPKPTRPEDYFPKPLPGKPTYLPLKLIPVHKLKTSRPR